MSGDGGSGTGKRNATSVQSPIPRPASRIPFYAALVVMFFSLNGWLHDLGDSYLFSAHMVQHLMLAFVVAPLLIMGTPGDMLRPLLEYPRRARRSPSGSPRRRDVSRSSTSSSRDGICRRSTTTRWRTIPRTSCNT